MGKNGITIKDVAERGGVSKTAVSYVLNGRQTGVRISDETRSRILAAARDLGYHPNALARGLARRQTDTLALVMQFPSVFSGWSGFTNELMHGATDAATALGFDLMLHTKAQDDLERDVAALTDGRADGALLLRDRDDPLAERLTARGFPFVQIFSHSSLVDACSVDCDNEAGARLAVEYLWGLGHRRIAHLSGSPHSAAAIERLNGYRATLRTNGVLPRPEWECEMTYGGGDIAPFLALMGQAEPPTAIFAWSDDAALQAMRVLRERLGQRVPEDVSLVGFDGTQMCDHAAPRLSSIRQPIYEMAMSGVSLLRQLVRREVVTDRHLLFAPTLQVRDSCGRPT